MLIYLIHLEHPACKILARYTSNQTLISALHCDLTGFLYSEELATRGTNRKEGSVLLDEVKEVICIDYRNLEVFAEILCESDTTAKIGRAIKKKFSTPHTLHYKTIILIVLQEFVAAMT